MATDDEQAKLLEELEAVTKEEREAARIVMAKFAAIGQRAGHDNPTLEELEQWEKARSDRSEVEGRIDAALKRIRAGI